MQRSLGVGVIEIKRMGQRAVYQRRCRRHIAPVVADNRTRAPRQTQSLYGSEQRRRRFRIVARPHYVAGNIENEELGPLDDFTG